MIEFLQALLTPIIAVATTLIAYQQYRIRRDERSLALYDRRLAIYKNAIGIVDKIRAGNDVTRLEAFTWLSSVAEARFLFGEEVQAVLEPLFGAVYEYAGESEAEVNQETLSVKCADAALKVESYRNSLEKVFEPYLQPAGSPIRRKPRLSIKKVEELIPKEKPDGDVPF